MRLLMEQIALQSADGARNILRVMHTEEPDAPVVLVMPAMGVGAKFYTRLCEYLVAHGVHAAVVDLRGIGNSSLRAQRGVDFGYKELIQDDWPTAMAAVRQRFPSSKIILFGHSLGGQLSSCYIAANPNAVAGLILCGACSVHYQGWPTFIDRIGVYAGTQTMAVIGRVLGYVPGKRIGFAGTEARQLVLDWAEQARTGQYKLAASTVDYDALMAKSTVPVLHISFDNDSYAPEQAVKNLWGKFKSAPVTWEHCLAAEMGLPAGNGHFTWAKKPEKIWQIMQPWLNNLP